MLRCEGARVKLFLRKLFFSMHWDRNYGTKKNDFSFTKEVALIWLTRATSSRGRLPHKLRQPKFLRPGLREHRTFLQIKRLIRQANFKTIRFTGLLIYRDGLGG